MKVPAISYKLTNISSLDFKTVENTNPNKLNSNSSFGFCYPKEFYLNFTGKSDLGLNKTLLKPVEHQESFFNSVVRRNNDSLSSLKNYYDANSHIKFLSNN